MAKNNYIARRDADRKGFFRAGEQTGRQDEYAREYDYVKGKWK